MTTDPKALIEQLEQEAACNDHAGLPDAATFYRNCAQALRDLTAENLQLAIQVSDQELKNAYREAEVARLKALGDGLAEALRCRTAKPSLVPELVAWEKNSDQ